MDKTANLRKTIILKDCFSAVQFGVTKKPDLFYGSEASKLFQLK